jgi:hypothetical protein
LASDSSHDAIIHQAGTKGAVGTILLHDKFSFPIQIRCAKRSRLFVSASQRAERQHYGKLKQYIKQGIRLECEPSSPAIKERAKKKKNDPKYVSSSNANTVISHKAQDHHSSQTPWPKQNTD